MKTKNLNVTVFCHANPVTGLGHLRRCALIHEALEACSQLDAQLIIFGERQEFIWLSKSAQWVSDTEEAMEHAFNDAMTGDAWIIDFNPGKIHMAFIEKNCTAFKSHEDKIIIALDQLTGILPIVDLLFIPCFYSNLKSEKVSCGWDHYILPSLPELAKIKQVLVLTGGSDALGLGSTLPSILESCIPQDWPVNWVTGPYAEKPTLSFKSSRWRFLTNPTNLSDLLASSQIVITCYGISFFEALKAGAVTILVEPEKLCSTEELSLLEHHGACIISHELKHLPQLCSTLFDHENPAPVQLLKNAEKLLFHTAGEKILVRHLLKLLDELKS